MESLKKKIGPLIIIGAIAIIIVFIALYTKNSASKDASSSDTTISYSISRESSTVFDALMDHSKTEGIEVKYNNNYEFGVLIESIGKIKNGDEGKYWQYYVNGELGDVAADKKNIDRDDLVEWRFEKVPF